MSQLLVIIKCSSCIPHHPCCCPAYFLSLLLCYCRQNEVMNKDYTLDSHHLLTDSQMKSSSSPPAHCSSSMSSFSANNSTSSSSSSFSSPVSTSSLPHIQSGSYHDSLKSRKGNKSPHHQRIPLPFSDVDLQSTSGFLLSSPSHPYLQLISCHLFNRGFTPDFLHYLIQRLKEEQEFSGKTPLQVLMKGDKSILDVSPDNAITFM